MFFQDRFDAGTSCGRSVIKRRQSYGGGITAFGRVEIEDRFFGTNHSPFEKAFVNISYLLDVESSVRKRATLKQLNCLKQVEDRPVVYG